MNNINVNHVNNPISINKQSHTSYWNKRNVSLLLTSSVLATASITSIVVGAISFFVFIPILSASLAFQAVVITAGSLLLIDSVLVALLTLLKNRSSLNKTIEPNIQEPEEHITLENPSNQLIPVNSVAGPLPQYQFNETFTLTVKGQKHQVAVNGILQEEKENVAPTLFYGDIQINGQTLKKVVVNLNDCFGYNLKPIVTHQLTQLSQIKVPFVIPSNESRQFPIHQNFLSYSLINDEDRILIKQNYFRCLFDQELEDAKKREENAAIQVQNDINNLEGILIEYERKGSFNSQSERKKYQLEPDHCNLHNYFAQLSPSSFNNLDESIMLDINEGQITPLKSDATPQDKMTAKFRFHHLLLETYGKTLTYTVWSRYEFSKIESLTLGDIKKALTGISANVKNADLKELYSVIKASEGRFTSGIEIKQMRCGNFLRHLDPILFQSIYESKDFESLSVEQIEFLLSAFRTLPILGDKTLKENRQTLTIYKDIEKFLGERNPPSYFVHDIKLLQNLNYWDKLDICSIKEFNGQQHDLAVSEFLAKNLAYYDLKVGMLLSLPTNTNKLEFFEVVDVLNERGVICFLIKSTNDESNLHLVFRGTDDAVQWLRNLDFRGVGYKSFSDQRPKIVNMLEKYLTKVSSLCVNLKISGHSLGGKDTQDAGALFLEVYSQSDTQNSFRKVAKLDLTTHNSARPEPQLNQTIKTCIKRIDQNKLPLQINLTHLQFEDLDYEDLIQKCGEVLIGADMDGDNGDFTFNSYSFFNRLMYNIKIEQKYGLKGVKQRHSFKAFNKELRGDIKFSVKSLSGNEMEEKLAGGYYWNPKHSSSLSWYGRVPFKYTENTMRFALNTMLFPFLTDRGRTKESHIYV